jgi:hypothetical protein
MVAESFTRRNRPVRQHADLSLHESNGQEGSEIWHHVAIRFIGCNPWPTSGPNLADAFTRETWRPERGGYLHPVKFAAPDPTRAALRE